MSADSASTRVFKESASFLMRERSPATFQLSILILSLCGSGVGFIVTLSYRGYCGGASFFGRDGLALTFNGDASTDSFSVGALAALRFNGVDLRQEFYVFTCQWLCTEERSSIHRRNTHIV